MKKILMSLTTIAITIITTGSMYIFTSELKNNKDLTKSEYVESKKELNVKDEISNNLKNNENEKGEKENNFNNNIKNKDDIVKKSQDNKEMLRPNNENDASKNQQGNVSSVFKVNKHTLLQNLPMKDKIKLVYMCKTLSTIDMGNIKKYMKSSNETEASAEIFKILKQRLPKEDYDEIKGILSPYVNIEYIESNI